MYPFLGYKWAATFAKDSELQRWLSIICSIKKISFWTLGKSFHPCCIYLSWLVSFCTISFGSLLQYLKHKNFFILNFPIHYYVFMFYSCSWSATINFNYVPISSPSLFLFSWPLIRDKLIWPICLPYGCCYAIWGFNYCPTFWNVNMCSCYLIKCYYHNSSFTLASSDSRNRWKCWTIRDWRSCPEK